MTTTLVDIALFGKFGKTGGIERSFAEQARAWHENGWRVELVVFRDGVRPYPDLLPGGVTVTDLQSRSKTLTTIKLLVFLVRRRPAVVYSAAHIPNMILACCALFRGFHGCRVFLGVQNNYVRSEKRGRGSAYRRKLALVRRLYRWADGVIAASEGVREDLVQFVGLAPRQVHTVHNACVPTDLAQRTQTPPDHPWYEHRSAPVVVTVGRLAAQKDYPTLLRAFAALLSRRDARLVLLGDGPEREALERICAELNIAGKVDFVGFQSNPYAYVAHADAFALSSVWEGFGNVVAEALAVGARVIATDCPSGPAEILANGRYGKLVPMRDPDALACAINDTLGGDHPHFEPEEAVERFTGEFAAGKTLAVFGIGQASETPSTSSGVAS